jgi:hypothetical protein
MIDIYTNVYYIKNKSKEFLMKRVNYLNNKDMLKEIHKSKLSYCHLLEKEHGRYDVIVDEYNDIFNDDIIQLAKENRAYQLTVESYEAAYLDWYNNSKKLKDKPKVADHRVHAVDIPTEDLIFRVMTYEHVPLEPGRKSKPKTTADAHSKCNFPPFKHFKSIDNEMREVVRSHWKGGFDNGHFSVDHGTVTNNLAKMYIKLCERYSMRSNWRGYTYVDEMRSHALLQLSQIGLQFNEHKSQNPFAYYTAAVTNSFTRVLNLEKRNQNIRDDLLQESGQLPSFSRQIDHEIAERAKWDEQMAAEHKDAGYNI